MWKEPIADQHSLYETLNEKKTTKNKRIFSAIQRISHSVSMKEKEQLPKNVRFSPHPLHIPIKAKKY